MKYEKYKNRIKWNKGKFLDYGAFAGINDFVTSFEPPCYITMLVGRVIEL